MSILVDKSTRVVVQGITGKAGSFHAAQMRSYGTQVVAGVTPQRRRTATHGSAHVLCDPLRNRHGEADVASPVEPQHRCTDIGGVAGLNEAIAGGA